MELNKKDADVMCGQIQEYATKDDAKSIGLWQCEPYNNSATKGNQYVESPYTPLIMGNQKCTHA